MAEIKKKKQRKKINSTLDLMYRSSHPYLFRLLNHYETDTHVFMIFESYDGESLDEKIMKDQCDLDNSLKCLLDCLQTCKAIKNDRNCVKIVANKYIDKNNPRIEFTIVEVKDIEVKDSKQPELF